MAKEKEIIDLDRLYKRNESKKEESKPKVSREERINLNELFEEEELESFKREYGEVSKQGQPVNIKNLQEIKEIENLSNAIKGRKANKKRRKTIKEIGKTHSRAVEAGKSVGFFTESKRNDVDKLATNAIDMFDKNIVAQKYLDTAGEKLKKPISNFLIKDVSKMIWNLLADNGGSAKVAKYFKDKGKLTPLACIPDRFGKKVYDLVEKAYNEQSKKEENPSFSMKAINVKELNDEFFSFNPNDISKDINKIINKTDKNQAIVEKELREPESIRYEAEKKAHEALGALLEEVVISKSGNDNVKKLKNAFTRTDDWKTVAGIIDSFSSGRESIVDPELAVIKLVHYLNNQVVNDDYDRIVEELTNELGVKVNEQGTDVEVNINFESLNSYQKYIDAKANYEEKQRAYDDKVAEVAGRVKEFNEGEIYNLEYQLAMENLAPIDRDINELLTEMSDYLKKDENGVVSANKLEEPEISKESIVSDFDDKKLRENNQKLNAETKKLQAYNLLSVTDHNKLVQEALERYNSLVQMREDAISAIANGISNAYPNLDAAEYEEIKNRISDYINNPIYQNIREQKQEVNENEETDEKINNLEEISDFTNENDTIDELSKQYSQVSRSFASLTPEEQTANVDLQEEMQGLRNKIAYRIFEKNKETNYPNGFENLTDEQKAVAGTRLRKVFEYEKNESRQNGNNIFHKVFQESGDTFEERVTSLAEKGEIGSEELANLRIAQKIFDFESKSGKIIFKKEMLKDDGKTFDEEKALSTVAEVTTRLESEKEAVGLCAKIDEKIAGELQNNISNETPSPQEDEHEEEIETIPNTAIVKFNNKYSSFAGQLKALKELAAIYAGIPNYTAESNTLITTPLSDEEIFDYIPKDEEQKEEQKDPTPTPTPDPPTPTPTPRILEVPYILKTDKNYNQPHPSEMGPFLPRTWYLGTYGQRDKLVDDLIKQNAETLNTLKSLVEKVGTQQTTQSVDINKLVEKLVDGNTASVEKISETIIKAFDTLNGEIKEIKTNSGKGGVTYVIKDNDNCAINLGKGGNVELVTNNNSNQNATNQTYTQTNNDYSISNYQTFEEITQKFVESGAPLPPNYVEKYTEIIKETEKTSEKITTEKILEKLIKEINNTSEGREGESGKGDTYVISGDTIIYNDNSKTNSDNVNNTTNNTIDPETAKENAKNICAILEQINETNQNTNNVIQSLNQAIVEGSKIDQTFLNNNDIKIDIKEAKEKVEEKGNTTTVQTPSGETIKIVNQFNPVNNNNPTFTQTMDDISVKTGNVTQKQEQFMNGGSGDQENPSEEDPKPDPKDPKKPVNKEPVKKPDLTKDELDLALDLGYAVAHTRAKKWVKNIQAQIDARKNEGASSEDEKLKKLNEELETAKEFEANAKQAIFAKTEKEREEAKEVVTDELSFKRTMDNNVAFENEIHDNVLDAHMTTQENLCFEIASFAVKNGLNIYNSDGSMKSKTDIVKILNSVKSQEYGKMGDLFELTCKGREEFEKTTGIVADIALGKGVSGLGVKEEDTSVVYTGREA